jgi:hypothetical protein
MHIKRQIDWQTDIFTDGVADRKTDIHMDCQSERQMCIKTEREMGKRTD